MMYPSLEFTRAVIADRERELQKMRAVRKARQARSESVQPAGGRRRRTRHRKPLEA
jgi:hypothetical protein